MKPRELWLSTDAVSQSLRHEPKHPANWLHVIEYKAYEALKKECDVLQLEKTYYYESLELHFNSKIDKLTEQNKIMREALLTIGHSGDVSCEQSNPDVNCRMIALSAIAKCGSTEPTAKENK